MRIVNEFAPGAIPGGATHWPSTAPGVPSARRKSIFQRLRAVFRLFARRRRAQRIVAQLQHLDSVALRDLGLHDRSWVAVEPGESIAAARRRIESEYLLSASSRFVVRSVDTSL